MKRQPCAIAISSRYGTEDEESKMHIWSFGEDGTNDVCDDLAWARVSAQLGLDIDRAPKVMRTTSSVTIRPVRHCPARARSYKRDGFAPLYLAGESSEK